MASELLSVMNPDKTIGDLIENVSGAVRGKPEAVKFAVTALIARGHLLIEDVPGIGKTTLAQGLARSISCSFNRIQFTSDLLPSDIIGVTVFSKPKQDFQFKPGPIFTNIVLADEINRATPKTQSALLEAMNEGQVSVENTTHRLPRPFMVMATQNPIEFYGTFPLPESQMDRFLMRIRMGYPGLDVEKEILKLGAGGALAEGVAPVLDGEDVAKMQEAAASVRVDDGLLDYLLRIVDATRRSDKVALGASPRGSLYLARAARAYAFISGRDYCVPDDIKSLAVSVLAHRIVLDLRGSGFGKRGEDADDIVRDIVESVEVPV